MHRIYHIRTDKLDVPVHLYLNIKNLKKMKLEIKTAKSVQPAIPELKREAKTLYFLVIGNEDGIVTLNVGEKTFTSINKLIDNEQTNTSQTKLDNTDKKR